jgi:hypothetical protein
MKKHFTKNLKLISLGIGLVLVASYAQASWSAPANSPSSYTANAPIHTGTGAQTKDGGLGIGSVFSAFKDANLNQSTIITGSLDGNTSTNVLSVGDNTNKVMLSATGDISATEYLKDAGVAKSTNDGKTSTLCADAVGKIILCQAPPVKINGTCGPTNGQTGILLPTTGLCNTGTPTTVTGNGDWVWSCNGSNGGTNASCSANNIISGVATQRQPVGAYPDRYTITFTKPTPAPLELLIGEKYNGCFYEVAYGYQLFPTSYTLKGSQTATYGDAWPWYVPVPQGVTSYVANTGTIPHTYSNGVKSYFTPVYDMFTDTHQTVGWGWYGQYFNCQHTTDTYFKLLGGYRANFTSTNTTAHNVN